MLEMIKAELVKALRKKRFWLLFAIIAVIVPLVQVISAGFLSGRVSSALAESATVTRAISEIASPYSLARNHVGGTLQALLYVLAAIVAVFIVGEDRTYKMWKTILVAQPNRLRVLSAKFLSGMLILLIMIVGGLIGALLFGSISVALGHNLRWRLGQSAWRYRLAMACFGSTTRAWFLNQLVDRFTRYRRDWRGGPAITG
jgi:ABC-type transport system involved in multi-copper enzyme maturation permease subunit